VGTPGKPVQCHREQLNQSKIFGLTFYFKVTVRFKRAHLDKPVQCHREQLNQSKIYGWTLTFYFRVTVRFKWAHLDKPVQCHREQINQSKMFENLMNYFYALKTTHYICIEILTPQLLVQRRKDFDA
jgi:hypothetical protein